MPRLLQRILSALFGRLSAVLYRIAVWISPISYARPDTWQQEVQQIRRDSGGSVVPKVVRTPSFSLGAVHDPDETSHLWRFEILQPDGTTGYFVGLDKDSGFEYLWALERAFECGRLLRGRDAA
jgi:hypothetical protein